MDLGNTRFKVQEVFCMGATKADIRYGAWLPHSQDKGTSTCNGQVARLIWFGHVIWHDTLSRLSFKVVDAETRGITGLEKWRSWLVAL